MTTINQFSRRPLFVLSIKAGVFTVINNDITAVESGCIFLNHLAMVDVDFAWLASSCAAALQCCCEREDEMSTLLSPGDGTESYMCSSPNSYGRLAVMFSAVCILALNMRGAWALSVCRCSICRRANHMTCRGTMRRCLHWRLPTRCSSLAARTSPSGCGHSTARQASLLNRYAINLLQNPSFTKTGAWHQLWS